MKRRSALTVALLAGAVAVVAAFASTGSADHPGSTTLTFVERNNQGTSRFIDIRPKSTRRNQGASPGDMFLGSSPYYNAANTQRVGKLFFKCTAVVGSKRPEGGTFLCDGTVRLSNGTLVLSAVLKGDNPPAGAVIGGTRAYEGASGSFTGDERRRTSVDTFHFDTD